MAKQNKAGATERDLPWWFEIYHIAWILIFPAVWYFLGTWAFICLLVLAAAFYGTYA